MSRLAVIMSLYKNDVLHYVNKAVTSIINQSFTDFDFYIQYDGPVKEEIDSFLSDIKDSRIHIYRRTENKGLAHSLNELLKIVLSGEYEYVARMDADDMSLENRFEKQVNFLDDNPNIDCVGTWAIEIKADESEFFRKQMPITHEECRKFYMKRNPMVHPTVMFRRSFFEKAGLYPEDTYQEEDTMLWANGFCSGCVFSNIPEYLFKFRIDDSFFNRRKGFRYAKDTFFIRHRIKRMLNFPLKADIYAFLFATSKIMPGSVLKLVYKIAR